MKSIVESKTPERRSLLALHYGPTGSGKTFTVQGRNERLKGSNGTLLRAVSDILHLVQDHLYTLPIAHTGFNQVEVTSWSDLDNGPNCKVAVFLSVFEIYNKQAFDLLNQKNRLELRGETTMRFLNGLVHRQISSVDDARSLIEGSWKNRATGATNVHTHSSRSHLFTSLKLVGISKQNSTLQNCCFVFTIGDLAGTEHASASANQQQQNEGIDINSSLMSLRKCIKTWKDMQTSSLNHHIPWRDSVLTQVLSPYFSGGVVHVVGHIDPSVHKLNEARSTLHFMDMLSKLEALPNDLQSRKRVKYSSADITVSELQNMLMKREDELLELEQDYQNAQQEWMHSSSILKNQINTLQQQLYDATQNNVKNIDSLEQHYQDMLVENEVRSRALEASKIELIEFAATNKLKTQIDQLKSENKVLKSDLSSAKLRGESLNNQLNDLQKILDACQEENNHLKDLNSKLEVEKTDLMDELSLLTKIQQQNTPNQGSAESGILPANSPKAFSRITSAEDGHDCVHNLNSQSGTSTEWCKHYGRLEVSEQDMQQDSLQLAAAQSHVEYLQNQISGLEASNRSDNQIPGSDKPLPLALSKGKSNNYDMNIEKPKTRKLRRKLIRVDTQDLLDQW
ncbi:kinesin motor domain-containing protein [Cladochytrium replicatum]|nr:kinesin motor domain-containing protein [Cladochytrium replicatum]